MSKVTAKNVASLPSGEYACGNNLYLIVAPTGARRWLFKYQRAGVLKKMGLGAAAGPKAVSMTDARTAALDNLRLLAKGIDPRAQRDSERTGTSRLFKDFAGEWRDIQKKGLKHHAAKNKLDRIVDVICAPLHSRTMEEIETTHVRDVLLKVWHQREMSRDTRQRIKKIIDAAIALGERTKPNCADWDSRLKPIMPKQPRRGSTRGHHKGMDWSDVPAFMRKLASVRDMSARAIEIAILTGARTEKVILMQWSQIDFAKALWTLKKGEMKNERDMITPLSKQALALLREAHETRISDYVFPGRDLRSTMSNNTMLKRVKELTGDDDVTMHGFRTSLRTWCQEETVFDREIVEHCLHHIIGDDAEKAYKSGQAVKKRSIVLQAWADFVAPAKVVALKRVA